MYMVVSLPEKSRRSTVQRKKMKSRACPSWRNTASRLSFAGISNMLHPLKLQYSDIVVVLCVAGSGSADVSLIGRYIFP